MTLKDLELLKLEKRNPKLYRRLVELGCRFLRLEILDTSDIKVEQGIYPREKTDWELVEIYKEAVLKGDIFPPVIVNEKGGLADGNHRFWGHSKAGSKIGAEVWFIPDQLMEYVAAICNTIGRGRAGKDLTGAEKQKAIIKGWEKGIRDINKLAEDVETTPGYVRKVLSSAGLIRDRKEEMKKRAKELREEGLSYREIAKKLEEEFGEKIDHKTVINWLKTGESITQVKISPSASTVRSVLDDPERLMEEEERELLQAEEEESPVPVYTQEDYKIKKFPDRVPEEDRRQTNYWKIRYGFTDEEAKQAVKATKAGVTEWEVVQVVNWERLDKGEPPIKENPNWKKEYENTPRRGRPPKGEDPTAFNDLTQLWDLKVAIANVAFDIVRKFSKKTAIEALKIVIKEVEEFPVAPGAGEFGKAKENVYIKYLREKSKKEDEELLRFAQRELAR